MISALLADVLALELSDHRDTRERPVFLERLCCEENGFAVMLVAEPALVREAVANLQLLKANRAPPVICKGTEKAAQFSPKGTLIGS
jgi:hypothetical protein